MTHFVNWVIFTHKVICAMRHAEGRMIEITGMKAGDESIPRSVTLSWLTSGHGMSSSVLISELAVGFCKANKKQVWKCLLTYNISG